MLSWTVYPIQSYNLLPTISEKGLWDFFFPFSLYTLYVLLLALESHFLIHAEIWGEFQVKYKQKQITCLVDLQKCDGRDHVTPHESQCHLLELDRVGCFCSGSFFTNLRILTVLGGNIFKVNWIHTHIFQPISFDYIILLDGARKAYVKYHSSVVLLRCCVANVSNCVCLCVCVCELTC